MGEKDYEGCEFNKVYFERPSAVLDSLTLARILFDGRDYLECAAILEGCLFSMGPEFYDTNIS